MKKSCAEMEIKMDNKPLIILTGPTASGKTELSVRLAKAINGEIISADSIQVYKYMDIGSAKVTKEEMNGITHYLIDELEPDEEFNIYIFKERAVKYINKIYEKGKIPIIAGGTGFYIQSVLYDIDFNKEDNDKCYREELEKIGKDMGREYLHNMLKSVDKKSAEDIHPNNIKRVIRALEYYKITGNKISEHNESQRKRKSPYNFRYFVLNMDRELLYDRINKRIDIMLEKGLAGEVEKLLKMGYDRNLVSMQGIGYKEIASYLKGEISYEEAVYIIKRDTKHFAKRQLTWFRREENAEFVNYRDFNMDKDKITEYLIRESLNTIEKGKGIL